MEREMCSYFKWQPNVNSSVSHDFESQVRHSFAGPGLYPPIILPQLSPALFHPSASFSTSIPSFGHCTSPPKPTQSAIISNPIVCYPTLPTPDTPLCSNSASTSPVSSSSPPTLLDVQNFDIKIVLSASSMMVSLASDVVAAPPALSIYPRRSTRPTWHRSPPNTPQKSKPGRDQFAFETIW